MDDFAVRLAFLKDEELKVQGEIASFSAEKQELIKDYATNRSRIRAVNEKISARQLELSDLVAAQEQALEQQRDEEARQKLGKHKRWVSHILEKARKEHGAIQEFLMCLREAGAKLDKLLRIREDVYGEAKRFGIEPDYASLRSALILQILQVLPILRHNLETPPSDKLSNVVSHLDFGLEGRLQHMAFEPDRLEKLYGGPLADRMYRIHEGDKMPLVSEQPTQRGKRRIVR